MSLYGQIKRIDDTVFRFDRIYRSRAQMDANAQNDGVYIGRYALVEYGQRYTTTANNEMVENSSNANELTTKDIEKLLEKGLDFFPTTDLIPIEGKTYYELKQDESSNKQMINLSNPYTSLSGSFPTDRQFYELNQGKINLYGDNALEDSNTYSNTFDSTVWLKIYNGKTEKYIMVAELNAILPKLSVEPIDTLEYQKVAREEDETELYTKDNEKINLAKEIFIKPSFDTIMDTELEYKLKMPKPLELNVNDENLKYNREGFNIVYSPENTKQSEPIINFTTEDKIYGNNYIHWVPEGLQLTDGNQLNPTGQTISSKTLDMNIPIFGNLVSDLYDLLFGKGTAKSKWVRPYFQQDWEKARDDITKDSYIHDDELFERSNDNYNWLQNVSIGDILGANNLGLASILASLFGVKNPITGEVTYYLKTGWDLNIDDEGKNPFITNKPLVVTTSNEEALASTEEIQIPYKGDYKINYDVWSLMEILETSNEQTETITP